MKPEKAIHVLIIEDDADYVDIVRMCLEEPDSMDMRFELERANSLELGLTLLGNAPYDAVLLDLNLPDSRGLETVMKVMGRYGELPILVMTNAGDESLAFEAMRLGAQDYMVKATSDSRVLKRSIWYAIERRKVLAQSEGLIKGAADGMVVIDRSGIVQYVNPRAEALFGIRATELLGRPFPHTVAAGEASVIKLTSPQGEVRSTEVRVSEIQWKDTPALLASIRDITELQKLEQLKAQIKEQRKMDQLKDELIATVSHEFRTPLTIVKGAIDNLKDEIAGPLTAKQKEVVALAQRNLARLAKMINNLLGLSRLESGRAKPLRRRLRAKPLLEETMLGFSVAARDRDIPVAEDFAQELGEVDVDPEMIGEVLNNLIDNALRFARSRVVVRARPVASSAEADIQTADGRGGVLVEVIDDGPGIPSDKIPELFNKFVQVNRSTSNPGYKGTGLGLTICKEILALHGSDIRVESSLGAGARFFFLLPSSEGRTPAPSPGA